MREARPARANLTSSRTGDFSWVRPRHARVTLSIAPARPR